MQGWKSLSGPDQPIVTAAVEARPIDFGVLPGGVHAPGVELSNRNGMSVRIMAFGAAIQSLSVPDRHGAPADVVLGYASAAQYLARPQYFGATIGRYANRIAGGEFVLDGCSYRLERNDGPNHLHGGSRGLDKVLWEIDSISSGPTARVVLSRISPHREGGYPGALCDDRRLYAPRMQRTVGRVSSADRQSDDRQHHEPQLFQSRGRSRRRRRHGASPHAFRRRV